MVDRSLRVCGPSIDVVHVHLFQQRTQAQTYGRPPLTKHRCWGHKLLTLGSFPQPWYGCWKRAQRLPLLHSSTQPLLWFVCSPSRRQSVFTDVTSLSANQSQSLNLQPQKSTAGLPVLLPPLKTFLGSYCLWSLLEIFPPSSTRMASPAPLPVSSKSPLMLRAQLGFSQPS